jgi:hypothetical protein
MDQGEALAALSELPVIARERERERERERKKIERAICWLG